MGTHYSPRIVTDRLVVALDVANPKSYPGSGTLLYDRSGNGINFEHRGTDPAKLTFENRHGGALKFDASGDDGAYPDPSEAFMQSTQNIPSMTAASISVIFENGTAADGFTNIPISGDCVVRMVNSDMVVRPAGIVAIGTNYNDIQYVPSSTIQTEILSGGVEFITATSDGITISMYRNGVFVGSATASTSRTTEAGLMNIGTRNDTNFENWSGWLYNLSIYNKTLSAAEVQQNYNALKGRFGL